MPRKSGEKRGVTVQEIAERLKARGMTAPHMSALIRDVFEVMAQELEDPTAEVRIPGFAKISTGYRAEREMRNVKTGEKFMAPIVRTIKFRPSITLKNRLNGRD